MRVWQRQPGEICHFVNGLQSDLVSCFTCMRSIFCSQRETIVPRPCSMLWSPFSSARAAGKRGAITWAERQCLSIILTVKQFSCWCQITWHFVVVIPDPRAIRCLTLSDPHSREGARGVQLVRWSLDGRCASWISSKFSPAPENA